MPSSKISRKVDSAEYFERLAMDFNEFKRTCDEFELPSLVTLRMGLMANQLHRAGGVIRNLTKKKRR